MPATDGGSAQELQLPLLTAESRRVTFFLSARLLRLSLYLLRISVTEHGGQMSAARGIMRCVE